MDFVTASEEISHPRLSTSAKGLLKRAWRISRYQFGSSRICSNERFYVGAAWTQQRGTAIKADPKSCSQWLAPSPGETAAPTQFVIHPIIRSPKPAHNVTSSPELLHRRKVQRIAAQELTRSLIACSSIAEAKDLYESHAEQFNAIHFAALFTALGRFSPCPASPPSRHLAPAVSTSHGHDQSYLTPPPPSPSPPPLPSSRRGSFAATTNAINHPRLVHPRSVSGPVRVPSGDGVDELRDFVSRQLLPHVGLRLMGLGSRQLVAVLVALAKLDCPPPDFWMSEWLQHFARGLNSPLAAATPAVAAGVARHSYTTAEAVAAGKGPAPQDVVAPPLGLSRSCTPTPTEMALTMWAIAKLQVQHRHHSSRASATNAAAAVPPPSAKLGGDGTATGLWHSGSGHASLLTDARTTAMLPPPPPPHRDGAAGPSLVWLQTMAHAFAAQSSAASAANVASYLWAAARLGYRPPAAVMAALMARCQDLMEVNSYRSCHSHGGSGIGPRELSEVLWSLAVLGFTPGEAWLRRASVELERLASGTAGGGGEGLAAAAAAVAGKKQEEEEQQQGAVRPSMPRPKVETEQEKGEKEGTLDWWSDHMGYAGCSSSGSTSSSSGGGGISPVICRHLGGAALPSPLVLDSRHAATCIWAFARLGHRPPARVLTALLRRVSTAAPLPAAEAATAPGASAAPQDLSMASWALGVLRFQPDPDQAMALLRSMAARLRDANSQNLVIWVTALARMRLAVPLPWFTAYLDRTERKLRSLSPLALVNWVDAVARLRTARPPRRSRLELLVKATRWEKNLLERQRQSQWQQQEVLRMPSAGTGEGSGGGGGGGAGGEVSLSSTAVTEVVTSRPPGLRGGVVGSSSSNSCAFEGSMGDSGGDGDSGDFRDQWTVVALPGPKPPRTAATHGTALGRQHQQQHQRHPSHRCPTARWPLAAGKSAPRRRLPPPPPQTTPPPRLTLRPLAASAALLTAATEEASLATTVPAAPVAPVTGMPGHGRGGSGSGAVSVFVRPAVRQLQRHRMMSPLLRLLEARMPEMDLEQHCRLAWAAAHLNTTIRRSWVDSLIGHTAEALERRLKIRQEQQQHQQLSATGAAAAVAAAAVAEAISGGMGIQERTAAAAMAPVVDARWLLKLARGVQMMLKGPNKGPGSRRRRRRWRQPMELQWRRPWRQRRRCQATAEEVAEATGGAAMAIGSELYSYIPRRWRLLLMVAMLPQLSALTNAQLLRFVRTVTQLRWGPDAAAAAATSAATFAATAGADGAIHVPAGIGGAAIGTGLPLGSRRGLERRVVRELGRYCRRRVAVTCGSEEACDLTTLELLRCTRGWESSSTGSD